MSRITVSTSDLEVDKPSGGGKGPRELYIVEIYIDGVHAATLHRHNFKLPGQMLDLVTILKARADNPGGSDPLPLGMSRVQCIAALRATRNAVIAAELAKEPAPVAGRKPKEKPPTRWPIDALIDHIETQGFPAPSIQ